MDASQTNALLAEFQGGNKEAFGKLYELYIRPIYNFVYYKTHHRETAEDITSQVFMKAYRAATSFEPEKGTFQAWLYQIARHAVIDHYRAARPTKDIEDVWDLSGKENIVRDTDNKILLEKVEKYLREFSPEQRDIIILRVWQELSYAEIAEVVGKSEASCKMSFSRSMKKLHEAMPDAMLVFIALIILKNKI